MQIAFASAARSPRTRARALILTCLVAGVVGEALFRGARLGLNFSLFVLLAASVHAAFATVHDPSCLRPRRWRRVFAAALPAVASVPVFAFDSQWARFFAVPSTLAWLVLVPRFIEYGFDLRVFGRLPERAAEALVRLAPAIARAMKLPLESLACSAGPGPMRAFRTTLVGLVLGIPSALVFMALFSFDPKFSRALVSLGRRSDDVFAFGLSALGLALLVVMLVAVEEVRAPRTTELCSHDGVEPYRACPRPDGMPQSNAMPIPPPRFVLLNGAWSLVLLQVSAVFGLYVALHARDLFAGHAHVRFTPGVTYAGQLHAGFFALLVAIALAVGLVLVGHALSARSTESRTSKQERTLVASELVLLTLSIPTLVSCAQKLVLYVEAYGQTYLRLGVAVAIVLAIPLVIITAFKSWRRSWDGYGSSLGLLALVVTSGSAFFDADAHVARINVERALRGLPLDSHYVESLGSTALRGFAAARPRASDAEARWVELARAFSASWPPSHAPLRGFRRETACRDALPASACMGE